MTTKRNYREETITFECDGCGDEFEASTDEWSAVPSQTLLERMLYQLHNEWLRFLKERV